MAKRTTITNQGLELLGSSAEATGQYWWIGYYGLAYVPNILKGDEVDLPSVNDCNNVNGTPNIASSDTDPVTAGMTRLTTHGDMIYNIFQGDLVGTGYYNCTSDGSVGGDLFGLTMYNTNIKKHYRYVLDENGNNTLVAWVDDPTDTTGLLLGKHTYLGTDGFVKSTIPIPAPLYYMGNTGNSSVDDFFPDFTDEVINGANIYPFVEDLELKPLGATSLSVPKVTVDYREYLDSQGNDETKVYVEQTNNPTNNGSDSVRTVGGAYFDLLELPTAVINDFSFDTTSWYASNLTLMPDYGEVVEATICKEFWKLFSISNYNKYHAPVNSVGHVLSSDLDNRNMAKVTKFFPIANYKVITTDTGTASSGESVEIATAMSFTINVDLAPRVKAQGFDENCDFDETSNLSFFDKYNNGNHPNDNYYPNTSNLIEDQFGRNIYNTSHTSFKFNRIGLYAVALRKCPFQKDKSDPIGEDVIVQFEINPDTEPVLFAVVDWDNTVTLDDTGNGIHEFRAELNVNLESPLGNVDADAIVRNSTIFYNLYTDDSLTWYQNQLVANASTQNAITELGLELAHIKNSGAGNCCPPADLSNKYASRNHSHNISGGLKNLKDGLNTGTLRGISTLEEGDSIEVEVYDSEYEDFITATESYSILDNSVVLGGEGNHIHLSPHSFIGNGINNRISGSDYSGIVVGNGNVLATNSLGERTVNSIITAGNNNKMASCNNSIINNGDSNVMTNSDSAIINGNSNAISRSSHKSTILNGSENTIDAAPSSMVQGDGNLISLSSYSTIIGEGNRIETFSTHSMAQGKHNYISAKFSSAIGYGSVSAHYGANVQSSGYFDDPGDAQRVRLQFRGTTTEAGITYENLQLLSLDGGNTNYYDMNNYYVLGDIRKTYGFMGTARIMAFSDQQQAASFTTGEAEGQKYIFVTLGEDAFNTEVEYFYILGTNSYNGMYDISYVDGTAKKYRLNVDSYPTTSVETGYVSPNEKPSVWTTTKRFTGWFGGFSDGDGNSRIRVEDVSTEDDYWADGYGYDSPNAYVNYSKGKLSIAVKGMDDTNYVNDNIRWLADVDILQIGGLPTNKIPIPT